MLFSNLYLVRNGVWARQYSSATYTVDEDPVHGGLPPAPADLISRKDTVGIIVFSVEDVAEENELASSFVFGREPQRLHSIEPVCKEMTWFKCINCYYCY